MLVDPSIEKILPKADCAYELVVLVSKRARQLVEGGQPMIPDKAANMVSLACKEIAQDKVVCIKGDKSKEIKVPKTKAARDAERAAQLAKEEAERQRELERAIQYESTSEIREDNSSEDATGLDMIEVVESFDEVPDVTDGDEELSDEEISEEEA
ncbi:MAG: DNA-directed RNA polymerase subunit omega [Clostridiales bacterium]|nr:DNA-directed RNA polymerase subunit omega [Clostridiales bacterium]